MELPTDATLSDLRQHLERSVPDIHELRLSQAMRELAEEEVLHADGANHLGDIVNGPLKAAELDLTVARELGTAHRHAPRANTAKCSS